MKSIIGGILIIILTITLPVFFATDLNLQAFDKGQIAPHTGLNVGDLGGFETGNGLPFYISEEYGVHK